MSWVATGVTVTSGIANFVGAKKAKRAAERRQKKLQAKLSHLEANRQAIINPYEGASDLSGLLTDYSGELTNPYSQLSVATKAAEMQIEEADISLANTLDTLRATGSGAGGATALAQAAMKSKKQVAANIEQQEKANEDRRAAGEATLQQQRIAEKKRIEGTQMSEAQRMQGLDAAGKQFMFQQREQREIVQLDRVSAQLSGAQQYAAAAQADATAALTGTVSAIGSMAASGAFSGNSTPQVSGVQVDTDLQSSGITNVPSGSGASGVSSITPGLFTTRAQAGH